jgi:hypothetical protein
MFGRFQYFKTLVVARYCASGFCYPEPGLFPPVRPARFPLAHIALQSSRVPALDLLQIEWSRGGARVAYLQRRIKTVASGISHVVNGLGSVVRYQTVI